MDVKFPPFQVRSAGVPNAGLVLDVRTVVMPAAYVADGHPVDLSGAYASVVAVVVLRAFVTATGAHDGRRYVPNEVGGDTYAARRFRLRADLPRAAITPAGTVAAASAGTPAGTVSQPTFTGTAMGTHTHGTTTAANLWQGAQAFGLGLSCAVGCNQEHVDRAPTPTSTATALASVAAASAGTPAGTVSQPTFTGTAMGTHTHGWTGTAVPAAAYAEEAAGTDLSTITVQYLIIGVPT